MCNGGYRAVPHHRLRSQLASTYDYESNKVTVQVPPSRPDILHQCDIIGTYPCPSTAAVIPLTPHHQRMWPSRSDTTTSRGLCPKAQPLAVSNP